MTDPMWTVILLAVLWLIVVVPMVLRRRDERAGQRSVTRFRASMNALSRRGVVTSGNADSRSRSSDGYDDADYVDPDYDGAEYDVAEYDDRPTVHVNGAGHGPVTRRPVPAAEESLMYAPDQHEMSSARRQMMARRRRSLTILGAGSALFLLLALVTGSTLAWVPAVFFVVGLAGYLLFLRSQARRDRERRQARRQRQSTRSTRDYDATDLEESEHSGTGPGGSGRGATAYGSSRRGATAYDPDRGSVGAQASGTRVRRVATVESVVRIDEDDVSLDHLDTIDLTGLYSEVEFEDPAVRRAG
jgi:membrane protein implicated in regulation of membrane protease activity